VFGKLVDRFAVGGHAPRKAYSLPAGRHAIRIRVHTASGDYDQSTTISEKFVSGGDNTLRVSFGKHREMRVESR
jgi:hypothetical protein